MGLRHYYAHLNIKYWVLGRRYFGQMQVWIWALSMYVAPFAPQFMDLYGTGAVNGALWTIAVEINSTFDAHSLYHTKKKTSFDTTNCDLSVRNFINGFHDRSLFLRRFILYLSFMVDNVHNWLLSLNTLLFAR